METYFIADTHFDDSDILRYENRPFRDVEEMNRVMISRWNKTVSPEDIVYVLGDFGAEGREADVLAWLNGTKYLVKGNHDTKSNAFYRAAGFAEVYDLPVLYQNFWLLSHEPLYVNENMPYANVFGHVHNNPIYRDASSHHFCVCAERIDCRPITLEEMLRRIKHDDFCMTAITSGSVYIVGNLRPNAEEQPRADAKRISEAKERISKYIKK